MKKKNPWIRTAVAFAFALVFFILIWIAPGHEALVEKIYSRGIYKLWAQMVSGVTGLIPVSLTEIGLLVGIPLLLVVAYSIALVVKKYAFQFRAIRSVLLMPYIMPLVGAVVLVDAVFSPAGGLAELAQALGLPAADWFHSDLAFWVVVLLFLWKSTGYGVILLLSGLATIDEAQYDAAELDGANAWMQLRYITVPQMWYSVYFTAVFSLINAFKCFREVFLLGGNHPNDSIYMLQHFINNTFQNLNYPKLASASIVLFVVMSAVFALLYRWVLKKEEMLG